MFWHRRIVGGRRFSQADLRAVLSRHGLALKQIHQLNKIGTPGWWLYGKVLRRKHINKVMLKLFDKTVWIWRRIDGLLPWRGLTMIAVAVKE